MSRSAHTEAQIIGAVKQVESGRKVEEVAREDVELIRTPLPDMSKRHACGLAGIAAASFRYESQRPSKDAELVALPVELRAL